MIREAKNKNTSVVVSFLIAVLFVSIFWIAPTYALPGTATQQLTINVTSEAPGINIVPGAPNTGASPLASELLSVTNPYFIIGALAMLAGIIFLVCKIKSSKSMKQRTFLSAVSIIGACSFITFVASLASNAYMIDMPAPEEPAIEFSHDPLEYSLQPGGSSHFEFDATVTTNLESPGYKLSAVSNNTHPGIKLEISGEDSEDKIVIPSAENDPVIIRESSENAGAGHTASHAIHVSLDDSVAPGSYTIDVAYTVETNLILPAGTNPPNVAETNPLILDVYPTTGWEGDTVAITSNALFTDVESVSIDGTTCTNWNVVNPSLIACELPAKTAGTTNDIIVMNNGVNVSDASVYTHMKITYFDPSLNTVNIGGTEYIFYPNGFTSSDCSTMTPSNDPIDSTPATSMVYVRDTRNKQTYKVKKMVDNKCWMVDNLKYIDTTIVNAADGTTGMVFNNDDHTNNNGSAAYNTVDETDTLGSANIDKAFYNNPMKSSYCYSLGNTMSNTLTHCGYLYNWYAATAGEGVYTNNTLGTNVTGNICPTNFRLPSGSSAYTATDNGNFLANADYPVLNVSMDAGSQQSGLSSHTGQTANWQPTGAWGGVFSGRWTNTSVDNDNTVGWSGVYWSSTVSSTAGSQRSLAIAATVVNPGNNVAASYTGNAVRCVMEQTVLY